MAGLKQTWATPLTDVSSVQREALGSIRFENAGKWYKYVQFKNVTGTVAAGAGSLVAYGSVLGYDSNLVVAKCADADTIVVCAGATLATITGTLTVSYFVWIQIAGRITLDTAVTSGAAGKSFFLSTTDKTPTVGANLFDQKAGISLNATTAVLLTCPF
jgi:hypothetical protein